MGLYTECRPYFFFIIWAYALDEDRVSLWGSVLDEDHFLLLFMGLCIGGLYWGLTPL